MRVNPAPAARNSDSGLELVFTDQAGERKLARSIDPALLGALIREGLEVDEEILRSELERALEESGHVVKGHGGGVDGQE